MAKCLRRALAATLCAALCFVLLPPTAQAITLTAVNDTLLPLSDGTMPVRRNGEMYAPYSVFSSLGISSSFDGGLLTMASGGGSLAFSPSEGYVYDQDSNSYSSPAYSINGTVYVPVKLVCGKFGLGFSTFSASGETVLRITGGAAQSDAAFASSAAGSISSAISSYYGEPSTPPSGGGTGTGPDIQGGNTTTTPNPNAEITIPETPNTPAKKPSRIYFAFFGPTTDNTPKVLAALDASGYQGTFFLPVDTANWNDDLIRRIAAEGHTLALLLYAPETAAPDSMVQQLTNANDRLRLACGLTTHIVSNAGGCAIWTAQQRQALIDAGYRMWDSTVESGDETLTAVASAASLSNTFAAADSAIVLRLRATSETASLVAAIADYMNQSGVPQGTISLSSAPINGAGDTR